MTTTDARTTANEFLAYATERADKSYAEAVAQMTAAMTAGRVSDYDHRTLAKAQATKTVHETLKAKIVFADDPATDAFAAAAVLAGEYTRDLLRPYGESRSTSAIANAVEAIEHEAKATFIRNFHELASVVESAR